MSRLLNLEDALEQLRSAFSHHNCKEDLGQAAHRVVRKAADK